MRRAKSATGLGVIAFILLSAFSIGCPRAARAEGKGSDCRYPAPPDAEKLFRYVKERLSAYGIEGPVRIDISLQGDSSTISLEHQGDRHQIRWELPSDCRGPFRIRSHISDDAPQWIRALDQDDLVNGFPLEPVVVTPGVNETRSVQWRVASTPALHSVFFFLLAVFLGARERNGKRAAYGAWLIIATVVAFELTVVWPLFDQPLARLSAQNRVLTAWGDVFADHGHPFLFFLLNKPFVHWSTEPWAIRSLPFVFLGAETGLLCLAALRSSGPVAGVLAGCWFVCEVPRRHGFYDFAGWDLAGAILLGQLIWWQFHSEGKPPSKLARWALLALMMGGMCSSWLMLVPAAILLGLVFWRWGREPGLRRWLGAVVVGSVGGWVWMMAQTFEQGFPPSHSVTRVAWEMVLETPVGREGWMILPMAAGLLWHLRHATRPESGFSLLAVVLTGLAVLSSSAILHVGSGYYFGLVTPLVVYASACGTARLFDMAADPLEKAVIGPPIRRVAALPAFVLVLVTLFWVTTSLPDDTIYDGDEWARKMPHLVRILSERPAPVVTNHAQFASHLRFEQARQAGDFSLVNTIASPEVYAATPEHCRLHDIESAPPEMRSPDHDAGKGSRWYLVLYHLNKRKRDFCLAALKADCQELFLADGRHHFYQCREEKAAVEP